MQGYVTAVGDLAPPPIQEPEVVPPDESRIDVGKVAVVAAGAAVVAVAAWLLLRDN